jgi:hypothetical protein
MSFDIFVQCFRNKEPATFKRAIFDEIFDSFVVDQRKHFLRVRYPDGSGSDIYVDDDDNLESIMFNHCGGDAFFEALYLLAKRTKAVIFWPNVDHISVVTDAETLQHLPSKFVDEDGRPEVVSNGEAITDAIRRS